jgi:hypothetical protein
LSAVDSAVDDAVDVDDSNGATTDEADETDEDDVADVADEADEAAYKAGEATCNEAARKSKRISKQWQTTMEFATECDCFTYISSLPHCGGVSKYQASLLRPPGQKGTLIHPTLDAKRSGATLLTTNASL